MNPQKSWSWFERYGQSITPPMTPVSFINWVWYEILSLELRHMAGFRPELKGMTLRPWLPAGVDRCDARVTVRGRPLALSVTRAAGPARARVNGLEQPMTDGTISIPYAASGETRVLITLPNKGVE
jgi:cellobiose phosphorylase